MFEIEQKVIDESRQGEAYQGIEEASQSSDKRFYIESYGCQMNFSDSEIIASILQTSGFGSTKDVDQASLILLNTC
jgi:tRNA-2-methylthio-N6-dimethylallyladenosine synthase